MSSNKDIDALGLREALHYCPKTGVMTWRKPSKFHAEKIGQEAGSPVKNRGGKAYHDISIGGKKYKRSRLAFLYMTGAFPDECVDHINGNSLDDRWENLRAATIAQNAKNHKRRSKKCDLPMGVRKAGSGRFVARIGHDKQQITIGTYDTIAEAKSAYRSARVKFFGEFA